VTNTATIHQLIEAQVASAPDRIAVVGAARALSFGALNEEANHLARAIVSEPDPDLPVVVACSAGTARVVALLATLKAGRFSASLDLSDPPDRLRSTIASLGARTIVTDDVDLAERNLGRSSARLVQVVSSPGDGADNLHWPARADGLARLALTSGSTAQPKAIMQTHATTLFGALTRNNAVHLCREDGMLVGTSVFTDLWRPLLVGATVYLFDFKADDIVFLDRWMATGRISALRSTPSVFRQLVATLALRRPSRGNRRTNLCPSLRVIELMGEPVPWQCVELYRTHFSRDCILINFLGCKEVLDYCAYYVGHRTRLRQAAVPAGYPLDGIALNVVDGTGRSVEAQTVGEITVASPSMSPGYWRRPDLTKERFCRHRGADERRTYATGDRGFLSPDGCLTFAGRQDSTVKIRGHRVDLAYVEGALRSLQPVREAAVITKTTGQQEVKLVAFVVARSPKPTTERELRRALAKQVPSYMVPSAIALLEEMPATAMGKVDYECLRSIAPASPTRTAPMPTPTPTRRDTVQNVIAAIWAQILELDDVGLEDDFFELGGDSLMIMQLCAAIGKRLGTELPLSVIFRCRTVAALARHVLGGVREELPRSTGRSQRTGETHPFGPVCAPSAAGALLQQGGLPLSFAQQRLWFLNRLLGRAAVYNVPRVMRLLGELNVAELSAAVNEIMRRHAVLRTFFALEDGTPVQVIEPESMLRLEVEDLRAWAPEEREGEARRLARAEAEAGFDLQRGPLLRARLLRLAEREHWLLVTMHHIVTDGWSWVVFWRELSLLYRAYRRGEASPLPELPLQYADYARWQRRWLQGEVLQRQLRYWKHVLAQLPVLDLPTDRIRPAWPSYRGARVAFALGRELTRSLRELGRREGTTLFMTLLAAFQVLLYRYSGQEDLAVGVPIAGRNRPELESLIGFFVNTLVLRGRLTGHLSFKQHLAAVREQALAAYTHQDLPFDKLVQELAPKRDLSRNPLFQVSLVLQNTPPEQCRLQGLRVERVSGLGNASAKFDLALVLTESTGRLFGRFEYATDLFEAATIERMARCWQVLLEEAVADPALPISELRLATPVGRK